MNWLRDLAFRWARRGHSYWIAEEATKNFAELAGVNGTAAKGAVVVLVDYVENGPASCVSHTWELSGWRVTLEKIEAE